MSDDKPESEYLDTSDSTPAVGSQPERAPGGDADSGYSSDRPRAPRDRGDMRDRGDRDGRDSRDGRDGGFRGRGKVYFRKKIDKIKAQNLTVDYKHPEILRRFVTEKGKILPRRITGTSAKNQRKLIREIKRARFLGFLPMG